MEKLQRLVPAALLRYFNRVDEAKGWVSDLARYEQRQQRRLQQQKQQAEEEKGRPALPTGATGASGAAADSSLLPPPPPPPLVRSLSIGGGNPAAPPHATVPASALAEVDAGADTVAVTQSGSGAGYEAICRPVAERAAFVLTTAVDGSDDERFHRHYPARLLPTPLRRRRHHPHRPCLCHGRRATAAAAAVAVAAATVVLGMVASTSAARSMACSAAVTVVEAWESPKEPIEPYQQPQPLGVPGVVTFESPLAHSRRQRRQWREATAPAHEQR